MINFFKNFSTIYIPLIVGTSILVTNKNLFYKKKINKDIYTFNCKSCNKKTNSNELCYDCWNIYYYPISK